MAGSRALVLALAGFGWLAGGWAAPGGPQPGDAREPISILVFTKTAGFRHDSIEDGVAALRALAGERGWSIDHTEDAARFTDDGLAGFEAVVFLSTTGDVLDDEQQGAFERYIASGRGFVGVHAAADTEYDWAWYGSLVGAYFQSHPAIQDAVVVVEDQDHESTRHLSGQWPRRDEWYDYRTNPRVQTADGAAVPTPDEPEEPFDAGSGDEGPRIRILASLLEDSYDGAAMGEDHPIAWCQEFGGGRSWYTGGGHTRESFAEPEFLEHLAGGIEWAAGLDADAGSDDEPR